MDSCTRATGGSAGTRRFTAFAMLVVAGLSAGAASASETVVFSSVMSDGTAGSGANSLLSYTFTSHTMWDGGVTSSGTLTRLSALSQPTESRIQIITPSNGSSGTSVGFPDSSVRPSTLLSFPTNPLVIAPRNQNTSGYVPGFPAGGIDLFGQTFQFRFYESFDDTGVDARWDALSIQFDDFEPVDKSQTINMGALQPHGAPDTRSGDLRSPGLLDRYNFRLAGGVNAGGPGSDYLHIEVVGGTLADTELALVDRTTGLVIATDDDGGEGPQDFWSLLSFGADPLGGGDGTGPNTPGGDGLILQPGNYQLVIGGFNTNFVLGMPAPLTGGINTGSYEVRFTYVPGPSGLSVLAAVGALLGRRRRR